MSELLLYIKTLKEIIDTHYEKGTVFYEEGEWYSREHSHHITPKELTDWVLKIVYPKIDNDYWDEILEKARKYDDLCK